jgi:hypothetical protein
VPEINCACVDVQGSILMRQDVKNRTHWFPSSTPAYLKRCPVAVVDVQKCTHMSLVMTLEDMLTVFIMRAFAPSLPSMRE